MNKSNRTPLASSCFPITANITESLLRGIDEGRTSLSSPDLLTDRPKLIIRWVSASLSHLQGDMIQKSEVGKLLETTAEHMTGQASQF
ncbi:hypothetical protein [Sulfitobacter sp. S45]|uniref:hypothetical protein n=1 Tax=Sulfitobacter sp. S45 TaxID=3368581 RepID=UPI003748C819